MWYIKVLIIIALKVIIWQDFKYRAISWWILPVIAILAILNAVNKMPVNQLAISTFFNMAAIFLQLIIVFTYFYIKGKNIRDILNTYLGVGDILFLLMLCFLFSPINYIVFCLISFILVLLFSVILLNVLPYGDRRIPLAGAISSLLIIVYIFSFFSTNIDLYSDQLVLNIIEKLYG